MGALGGKKVLVVGRGSGIARAVALGARHAGAEVLVAGRDPGALRGAYEGESGIAAEAVDVVDEASIAALAVRLGHLDHVVTTASARARGGVGDLTPETVALSFATKAIGPILLAKHLAPIMPSDGSFVLSSGATAIRPAPGMQAVAGTNGGVDAIAPGTIDSGAYDALGEEGKAALFYRRSENNPAGRIGSSEDVAQAVLFALTADFLTGVSIPVDGGEILV